MVSSPRLLCLVLLGAVAGTSTSAQDALRQSMAGELALPSRSTPVANQPYTVKFGDFRLLASASLGAAYNDNVRISEDRQLDDFILTPSLQLVATHPITHRNLLRLRLGVGYNYYTQHDEYSSWRLESGSELSFDMYVKDLWINLHDRFSYVVNSGNEAGVANTARYGGFNNVAGITTTWDLNDLILTLGYDHQNYFSASSEFEQMNRASEVLLGRAGFRISPALTTGLEATGTFTSYGEEGLNDNTGYSAGLYADWQPGSYFRVQPRVGYNAYFFDQTSRFVRAVDQDGYYAALSIVHDITEAVSYSITTGHELRLGIQADSIESTYVRPSATWRFIKDWAFTTNLSYEHGTQGAGRNLGNFEEEYDWFGSGLSLSHAITRKLSGSLSYRYTLRTTDAASREYTQNVVALNLTYSLQ